MTLSPCEKRQTYSLINFLKFPLRIPWPFLLGCNLSEKRSNLLFMFLCTIKAKFSAVHFYSNSLLTFFSFSDSQTPLGIKDDIDTSVLLIFIFFAKLRISLAISDGFWLLFKSFVSVWKIAMSGFLAMAGFI